MHQYTERSMNLFYIGIDVSKKSCHCIILDQEGVNKTGSAHSHKRP